MKQKITKVRKKHFSDKSDIIVDDNTSDIVLEETLPVKYAYLSFSGTEPNKPVTGNIVFDGKASIIGLRDPIEDTDAGNLNTVLNEIDSQKKLFIENDQDCLVKSFSMKGHSIFSSQPLFQDSDPVTLGQLTSMMEYYVSCNEESSKEVIQGDLIFDNGSVIKNFLPPVEEGDLVGVIDAQEYLQEKMKDLVRKDNFSLTGSLDLRGHKINEVADPIDDSDGVNVGYFKKFYQDFDVMSSSDQEKTFFGNLFFDKRSIIKNIPLHKNPSDAIGKEECHSMIKALLSDLVNNSVTELEGSFDLNQHMIINLGDPEENNDLLNIVTLIKILSPYIPYKGNNPLTPLKGDILLNNQNIKNIKPSSGNKEAISYGECKQIILSKKSQYIFQNNPKLSAYLRISQNKVLNLKDPVDLADGVNVRTLQTTIKNKLSQIIKPKNNSPMEDDIDASSYLVIDLADALDDTDAVNIRTMSHLVTHICEQQYLSKSGGILSGDILLNQNKIMRLPSPSFDQDVVTVSYLKDRLDEYDSIISSKQKTPIRHDLIFRDNHTLRGLSDPRKPNEAVTLGYLKKQTEHFIPIQGNKGGKPLSNLKFSLGCGLKNVIDCTEDDEIVNLRTLKKIVSKISDNFIPKTSKNPISISGVLDMHGNSITEVSKAVQDFDIINLQELNDLTVPLIDFKGPPVEMISDLVLDKGKIFLFSDPKTNKEPFNKKFLENSLKRYLNKTTSLTDPLKINLNLGTRRTVFAPCAATDLLDAVNLKTTLSQIKSRMDNFFTTQTIKLSTADQKFNQSLVVNELQNIKDPQEDKDAVKYADVLKLASKNVPLSDESGITRIEGSLDCYPSTNLSDLRDAQSPLEILNFRKCQKLMEKYAQVTSGEFLVNGILDCNFLFKPSGLANPLMYTDATNLLTLKSLLNQLKKRYVGGNAISQMEGPIDLNGHCITGIASPINSDDGVSLNYLNEGLEKLALTDEDQNILCNINFLHAKTITGFGHSKMLSSAVSLQTLKDIQDTYVNLTSAEDTVEMKGNVFCNHEAFLSVTGFAENPSDVLSLGQLRSIMSRDDFITLQKGVVSGDLNFGNHKISGLKINSDPEETATLWSLKTKMKSYLSSKGNSLEEPFTVDLVFDQTSRLTGLKDAEDELDLANFKNLKNEIKALEERFIKENHVIFDENIDMQGFTISNVKDPVDNNDGVNLKTLHQFVKELLPKQSNVAQEISGNIYLDETSRLFIECLPLKETDVINTEHLLNLINIKTTELVRIESENTIIKGNLFIEGEITNLGDPENDHDGVNRGFADRLLSTKGADLPDPILGTINSDLIITGKLIGVGDPETPGDVVNLKTFNVNLQSLENELLSPLGGSLRGNLGASLFIGLPKPVHDKNPVDFPVAVEKTRLACHGCLPNQNPTSQYDIRLNNRKVINLAPSEDREDAVNLQEMISIMSNKLPIENRTAEHKISSLWNLNDYSIEQHGDPIIATQGLNLRTLNVKLNSMTTELLPCRNETDFISVDAVDCTGFKVINLGDAENAGDAVNLKTIKDKFSDKLRIKGDEEVKICSNLSLNKQHYVTLETLPSHDEDVVNYAFINKILAEKRELMIAKQPAIFVQGNKKNPGIESLITSDSEKTCVSQKISLNMEGNLKATVIKNLIDPDSEQAPVNRSYFFKRLQEWSSFLLPIENENKKIHFIQKDLDMNGHEITNVSSHYNNHSGVPLFELVELTQKYLSKQGGTFSKSLAVNGKIYGLPNPRNDDDLVNLKFASEALNEALTFTISNQEPLAVNYDLLFAEKGQLKEVGMPQEDGDVTTLAFWKSCFNKPHASYVAVLPKKINPVKKNTYLNWKQVDADNNDYYVLNGDVNDNISFKESGLYQVTLILSVGEIIFDKSFDTISPFELQLSNCNETITLETAYLSSYSTTCITSSFEIDKRNRQDNYCLKLFNPSYDCEIKESNLSLIMISELANSSKQT